MIKNVAVIIPARNEETVIKDTLLSLKGIIAYRHVYVVDDNSNDKTKKLGRKITKNVLRLDKNVGKANALNKVLKHYSIAEKYDFVMFLDADTKILPGFFEEVMKEFERKPEAVAVVGQVKGTVQNALTAYRAWEYELGQSIFKQAQNNIQAILVAPGCATVYRTKIFQMTGMPTGTLAEDMDLTFLIHRKQWGEIVYQPKAWVQTQDPLTLRDFVKQIHRWYVGFWQAVVKHQIPWHGQRLDAEAAIMGMEGLLQGMLVALYVALITVAWQSIKNELIILFLIDVAIFMIPSLYIVKLRLKSKRLLVYLPQIYLIRLLSSVMFFYSFLKVVLAHDGKIKWISPIRYQVREG